MNCEYARDYYNVPAYIGRRVSYNGKGGIIAEDRGNYIGVNFDQDKPGIISNIHPKEDGLVYLGMGKVRKMTRSQKRYKEYLRSEVNESFAEWMGFK